MNKTTYIYALEFPKGNIRYIGKSNNPKKRLKKHIRESLASTETHKKAWINGLLKKNKKPILSIIDDVDFDDWPIMEQYWISQFKTWGFNLVNTTDGGEGFYCQSNEIREKAKKTMRKKFDSGWRPDIDRKEIGKKISKTKKGNVVISEKQKKEISLTLKRKYKTGEIIHHMTGKTCISPMKNKHHTEYSKKKASKSAKNRQKIECPWCGKIVDISTSNYHHFDGCVMNPNNDKKLREFKYHHKEKQCPHCGKVGRGGNMKRYHFDNCKFKNN